MEQRDFFPIGQALVFALRAMRTHASIVSGAYKSRETQRGIGPEQSQNLRHEAVIDGIPMVICEDCRAYIPDTGTTTCKCDIEWQDSVPRWRPLTEEELLQQELGTMDSHIRLCNECVEHLLDSKE